MAMLILCRVGAQTPTGAEEGACLGECGPRVWSVGGLAVDWVLTSHGAGTSVLFLSGPDHFEPAGPT